MQDIAQSAQEEFEIWSAAWNAGDIEGYLIGYWESSKTRYISNGSLIEGKDNIAEMYRTRFADSSQMGQLKLNQFDLTLMGEENVMIFGAFTYTLEDQSSNGVFTLHLRKVDENWRIITDHTSSS